MREIEIMPHRKHENGTQGISNTSRLHAYEECIQYTIFYTQQPPKAKYRLCMQILFICLYCNLYNVCMVWAHFKPPSRRYLTIQ
jgi:hypothetical protein